MATQNVVEAVAELGSKCYRERAALEREVDRLRTALAKANDQTEYFERCWCLRGDALGRIAAASTTNPAARKIAIDALGGET